MMAFSAMVLARRNCRQIGASIATVLIAVVLVFASRCGLAAQPWWQISAALDYTPHGTQPGLAFSLIGSNNCAGCHASRNSNDHAFFPWDTWSGSMMANATRDPLFWAALDVANHDQPGIGDYCLRCHTPNGWYGGRVVKAGSGGTTIDGSNGCLLQGNYASGDGGDFGGESCHFCHRLQDTGPQGQPAYLENANAWMDDGDCNGGGQPCRRGPYNYQPGGAISAPPHAWAASAYHQQSRICGLCHNVSTPDTDAGPLKTLIDVHGNNTGIPFPVERTYSEWQQSDFSDLIFRDGFGDIRFTPTIARSQQCQDCHMPNSPDPSAYACVLTPPGSRSGNLPTHSFAGGNTWVPTILAGEYGAQLSRTSAFAQTIGAAQQMLAGAAKIGITRNKLIAPSATIAGRLNLTARVTNLSGHKLPTGYAEGRRVWLNVQVRDGNNVLIAESAAYDAATRVLTQDTQARIYEVSQGIWDSASSSCRTTDAGGAAQFHFVLNNCIAKDNRIPPLGFSGGGNIETAPVGQTYAMVAANPTRLVNYDDASYVFSVPPATVLPLSVTTTLYYQTASKPYIEFLANQAQAGSFPAENSMCSGSADRPFDVGPQTRSRGLYIYQLWNNAANDTTQPGYGASPPQQMGNVVTTTVSP